jgi:uncharacterized protein (TIGR03435 family)
MNIALGRTLLHFLWQATLIAMIYGAIRALASWSQPATRYLMGCAALSVMLAAPIVTFCIVRHAEPPATASSTQPQLGPGGPSHTSSLTLRVDRGTFSSILWKQFLSRIVQLWIAGVLVLLTRLAGGCVITSRVRFRLTRSAPGEWLETVEDLKNRLGVTRPVRLVLSSFTAAPAVIGWLRPIILLPVEAITGLPSDQLRALLAHELAHIRRHDYLVNLLQSIVEALLFYHPAVWWVSGHLRAERELCCDDAAVSLSGDPLTYARALTQLESWRVVRIAGVMAATGSSLPNRIARLLRLPRPESRSLSGVGLLLSVVAIAIAATAFRGFGQPVDSPQFEAASIKAAPVPFGQRIRLGMRSDPQLFTGSFVSLLDLVGKAYDIDIARISGAADWMAKDRYQVMATVPKGTPKDQIPRLLQALLAERFKLSVRRDSKMTRVYALVPAKGGPKMKPSEIEIDPARGAFEGIGKLTAPILMGPNGRAGLCCGLAELQASMERFAFLLSAVTDRPVQDETGLQGLFDISLQWSPENSASPDDAASIPSGPSIYTALPEQLGLKLEPRTASLEYLIVEHAEKPTGN